MGRQLTHPRRKSRIARLISWGLLLATLVGGFLAVNGEAAQRADAHTTTIGLVNEDLAAVFNGTEYTFGASFVDRISKDTEYNWTVLSRSVAEKAYKDRSVDAVIYLPQSFSHDILTLQELDPTKATVEYKLQHQADVQADRLLDNKILSVVSGFNQGVVKMYYASLAENIAEADGHMRDSLSNEEALIKAFTSEVQEPFVATMPDFTGFVQSAQGLKDVNASTVEAQNAFTQSVTDQLTKTSDALSGQLPPIGDYMKRQQEIANINAANSNKGITEQAASDRDFYGTQFNDLKIRMLCQFAGRDAEDADAACTDANGTVPMPLRGHVDALRTAADDHTGPVSTLQANAATAQSDIAASVTRLQALETLLTALSDPDNPPTKPVTIAPDVLTTLHEDITSLQAASSLLDVSIPAPQFAALLADLGAWYDGTVKSVKDATLTTSTVKNLKVQDWFSHTPDGTEVYVDSSDGLQKSITDLVTQSADAAGKIGSSKLTVPDNSAQFDSLLKSAGSTLGGAKSLLGGANDLLNTGNNALGENQDYYNNFSTVLANTRTQGVDTGKINDFLSAPINAKNITPTRPAVTDTFDPQWLLIFAGGLIAGVLVMLLGNLIRTRKTA
ncbi:MAG: type VII secretion protein EsaA [Leifsonia sp.]